MSTTADPRRPLGIDPQAVTGPYSTKPAARTSPDQGGTLDRAIIATLPNGQRVIIGELWAMGPDESGERVSLDVETHAEWLVDLLNNVLAGGAP